MGGGGMTGGRTRCACCYVTHKLIVLLVAVRAELRIASAPLSCRPRVHHQVQLRFPFPGYPWVSFFSLPRRKRCLVVSQRRRPPCREPATSLMEIVDRLSKPRCRRAAKQTAALACRDSARLRGSPACCQRMPRRTHRVGGPAAPRPAAAPGAPTCETPLAQPTGAPCALRYALLLSSAHPLPACRARPPQEPPARLVRRQRSIASGRAPSRCARFASTSARPIY